MHGRAACPPALCSVLARVLLHACSVASGVLRVLCVSQSSCQLSGEGLTCACGCGALGARQAGAWLVRQCKKKDSVHGVGGARYKICRTKFNRTNCVHRRTPRAPAVFFNIQFHDHHVYKHHHLFTFTLLSDVSSSSNTVIINTVVHLVSCNEPDIARGVGLAPEIPTPRAAHRPVHRREATPSHTEPDTRRHANPTVLRRFSRATTG